jgi:hypothetical protein
MFTCKSSFLKTVHAKRCNRRQRLWPKFGFDSKEAQEERKELFLEDLFHARNMEQFRIIHQSDV